MLKCRRINALVDRPFTAGVGAVNEAQSERLVRVGGLWCDVLNGILLPKATEVRPQRPRAEVVGVQQGEILAPLKQPLPAERAHGAERAIRAKHCEAPVFLVFVTLKCRPCIVRDAIDIRKLVLYREQNGTSDFSPHELVLTAATDVARAQPGPAVLFDDLLVS